MKRNLTLFLASALLLGLAGCASNNGLYHWGNYETALYEQQRSPQELEAYIESLTTTVSENKKPIAPGLYAELGSAYLQAGDINSAITWYTKERDTWPESHGLMNSLITNLKRRLPAEEQSSVKDDSNAMD